MWHLIHQLSISRLKKVPLPKNLIRQIFQRQTFISDESLKLQYYLENI